MREVITCKGLNMSSLGDFSDNRLATFRRSQDPRLPSRRILCHRQTKHLRPLSPFHQSILSRSSRATSSSSRRNRSTCFTPTL